MPLLIWLAHGNALGPIFFKFKVAGMGCQFARFWGGVLVGASMFCARAFAADAAIETTEPTYFLVDGNPVAAKYVAGKLVRLPPQDAQDSEGLAALEAVSALMRAPQLSSFPRWNGPSIPHLSAPHTPSYGTPMFEVSFENSGEHDVRGTIIWSGAASFHLVSRRGPHHISDLLRRRLTADSRRTLLPLLDLRGDKSVGRRLQVVGPVHLHDYGRTVAAPHLAFVDITWRIADMPESLSNRGIDSWLPLWRVEYVLDTRSGKLIYRATANVGNSASRKMRLLQQPGGPLLMITPLACSDGDEPLILDLNHETYGTGRRSDVPPVSHCFPGQ